MNTKEKVAAIIDYLAITKPKNTCNCVECWNCSGSDKRPVMIGDVFDKMMKSLDKNIINKDSELVELWGNCSDNSYMDGEHTAFKESLNKIFDGEIKEDYRRTDLSRPLPMDFDKIHKACKLHKYKRFKDQNVQALLEFLWEMFKDKINEN